MLHKKQYPKQFNHTNLYSNLLAPSTDNIQFKCVVSQIEKTHNALSKIVCNRLKEKFNTLHSMTNRKENLHKKRFDVNILWFLPL